MEYHVLIADDEPEIRSILADWFSEMFPKESQDNCVIYEAKNGTEAAAKADECRKSGKSLDLAIIDVVMPNRSGLEAIANLQRASPSTHIVIFSATASASLRAEQLQARYGSKVTVLDKPIRKAEFFDAIKNVLGGNYRA